jgi:hypothetical protein
METVLSTKPSQLNLGDILLHEMSGQTLHLTESRNSEKVDCFLTLILVGVQGENLSFNKIFLLR